MVICYCLQLPYIWTQLDGDLLLSRAALYMDTARWRSPGVYNYYVYEHG